MQTYDVKIFGERNSATNALKIILESNSKSRVFPGTSRELEGRMDRYWQKLRSSGQKVLGATTSSGAGKGEEDVDKLFDGQPPTRSWKHTATYFESVEDFRGSLVIFCVRNPLSWTYSLFKNPHNAKSPVPSRFRDFLDMDWPLLGRDNLPFQALKPHQLCEEKVKSYSRMIEQLEAAKIAFKVVKFEDIVTGQEDVFASLAKHLKAPGKVFSPLHKSTKDKSKTASYYEAYYGDELWRNEIGAEVEVLSERLDSDLFSSFGYKL